MLLLLPVKHALKNELETDIQSQLLHKLLGAQSRIPQPKRCDRRFRDRLLLDFGHLLYAIP